MFYKIKNDAMFKAIFCKKENTLEIVHNLLSKNIDINIIASATNLSIEEINKLKV